MNEDISTSATLDKDEKGPIINVGTIKEILLIEIKRTLNEFWREYATLNNEISPEKKLILLNDHIQNLTLWLKIDRQ